MKNIVCKGTAFFRNYKEKQPKMCDFVKSILQNARKMG
jgi:hypothetical protein